MIIKIRLELMFLILVYRVKFKNLGKILYINDYFLKIFFYFLSYKNNKNIYI
jgi:hypothetical protein